MNGDRRVGVVGLGLLGSAIAARLTDAGFDVTGYDRSAEAMHRFAGRSGKEAMQAKRVVLAVFDTSDVEDVVHESRARLYIDCTTGDPLRIEALAARLAREGVGYVEAPISGGSETARRGEATMLVGGDTAGCEDLLSAISSRRVHVGRIGMAARAKLATNLVLGLSRAALAEGMAFAESQGIGRAQFMEILTQTPAAAPSALGKGARMVSGDYRPESRIRQHLKDVRRMREVSGVPLPLTQAHEQLLSAAVDAGDGELDNAALIRRWEKA
ncbi:MAG: NAD(P)-dependent oxidoreductase [Candidatus Parcubacteria bacterium]|nr:NAD(P)-dependent oxidoreductase [Burkholderiales bacterium]